MTYLSTNGAPTISTRSDSMGVAVVNKVSPTRALVINSFNEWILVTPKDTFNDSTLDLTEKLNVNSKVIYKANRLSASNYKQLAVYIRPVTSNGVFNGDGKLVEVKATFGYANSPKYGSIFVPVLAIKESIMSENFVQRCRDISKWLRPGDPISFVAVSDESTKNRSSYAVDVQLAFNDDAKKPMVGIITEIRRSSAAVWAKNFPVLIFNDHHFGVDWTVDLRKFFIEGDRVTFRASKIGCDIDGISQLEAEDSKQGEALRHARATFKSQSKAYTEMSGPKPVDGNQSDQGSWSSKNSPGECFLSSVAGVSHSAAFPACTAVLNQEVAVQCEKTPEEILLNKMLNDRDIMNLVRQNHVGILRRMLNL